MTALTADPELPTTPTRPGHALLRKVRTPGLPPFVVDTGDPARALVGCRCRPGVWLSPVVPGPADQGGGVVDADLVWRRHFQHDRRHGPLVPRTRRVKI